MDTPSPEARPTPQLPESVEGEPGEGDGFVRVAAAGLVQDPGGALVDLDQVGVGGGVGREAEAGGPAQAAVVAGAYGHMAACLGVAGCGQQEGAGLPVLVCLEDASLDDGRGHVLGGGEGCVQGLSAVAAVGVGAGDGDGAVLVAGVEVDAPVGQLGGAGLVDVDASVGCGIDVADAPGGAAVVAEQGVPAVVTGFCSVVGAAAGGAVEWLAGMTRRPVWGPLVSASPWPGPVAYQRQSCCLAWSVISVGADQVRPAVSLCWT